MRRRILRKFGFKKDQSGIISRYVRENGAWDSHLQLTKQYILKSAKSKDKKTAVILGSGWLLDVPTVELAQLFDRIVLVDIFHPRQIEHKLRKQKNIEFLSSDITGLAQPIYELLKKRKKETIKLSEIKPVYDKSFTECMNVADFVVSVNILNQLDILLCDYIEKLGIYEQEEINEFRTYVQSLHIGLLPPKKSVIITDHEEINLNDNDKIINRKNLIHTDLLPQNNATKWQWKFDQSKTYHNHCKTFFKVIAVDI